MPRDNPGSDNKRRVSNRRGFLKGIGASATVAIAGCTGGGNQQGGGGTPQTGTVGDTPKGGKTLTFLLEAPGKGVEEALNNIKARYEEETGNTVEFGIPPAGKGVGERLSQLVSAGNPPEIIQSGQGKMARFFSQDIISPMTEAYNTVADRYSDVSRASKFRVDGEEYGIPLYHQRGINWARTDVWGDDLPTTWEEEEARAKEMDNPDDLRGYFVGAKPADACVNLMVQGMGYQNGCRSFAEKNGEVQTVIGTDFKDQWVGVFEHLDTLHEYGPRAADAGCAQMSNSIASGVSSGQWYIGFRPPLKANRQERGYADKVKTFRSVGKSDLEKKDYGSSILIGSAKGSDQQLARQFAEFLYRQEEVTEYLMGVPIHNIPPFPEIIESDAYQSALEGFVSEAAFTMETVNAFFDTLDEGLSPVTEVEPFFQYGGVPYGLGLYGQSAAEVLIQDEDPETAVDNLHERTQDAISEAKG